MKKLAIYGIIVGSAVVIGFGGGTLIKRVFTEPERDYSGFDVSLYKIDGDTLISKTEGYASKEVAFNNMTAVDVTNYALEKYRRCENSYSYGVGLSSNDSFHVDQYIRNAQVKNGNICFEESISKSSFVAVALRSYEDKAAEIVNVHRNKTDDPNNVSGPAYVFIDANPRAIYQAATEYTLENYEGAFGRTPADVFNYIIHKDSVSSVEKSVDEDGNYVINLTMIPDIATYSYQMQMKTLSDLKNRPKFSAVNLKFTLDSELTLLKFNVHEVYKATMGFEAEMVANIEYKYFSDRYYKVPELDEGFNYNALEKGEII